MELKGVYKLTYTVDKEVKELTVTVELLLRDGMKEPFKNLYVGNAIVNGKPYEEDNSLEYCVDAKVAAERIGHEHRDKLIKKYKKSEHKFKIKKEEIK